MGQLVGPVGVFQVLLPAAPPEPPLLLEDVHAVGADPGFPVEVRPPEAEDVLVLVQEDLAVQAPELGFGVDVEEEDAPGVQGLEDPGKGLPEGGGVRDVVDPVQAADRQVHRGGEPQLLHPLADEVGRILRQLGGLDDVKIPLGIIDAS